MRAIKASSLLRLLFVLTVAFLCVSSTAFAQLGLNQERISEAQWRRGFHGFNMITEGNDLERITLDEFQSAQPKDVLIIVIGRLRNLPLHVTNHVNLGGSALVASDSTQPFNANFAGFQFARLVSFPTRDSEAFAEMKDCPLVTDCRDHPVMTDVAEIVTNRPGFILSDHRSTLATLPSSFRRRGRSKSFAAASEFRSGGRAIAVGDQSVFTNQMIIYGDNALFANQAVKWLKKDSVKKFLILVDGVEYSGLDPGDVIVDVPPPTQKEVLDAIQDVPPSAMLEFANSVAAVVEDENMVNDFIHDSTDNIPEWFLNRLYIFLLFTIACCAFVAAFIFQGKLQAQTASEVALKRSRDEQVDIKAIQFRERQQAAHFLLDKFCVDLANRRFSDWPSFPTEMNFDEDQQSKNVFESMTKMSVLYKSKPTGFWTRRRLAKLEKEIVCWRQYFENRQALQT